SNLTLSHYLNYLRALLFKVYFKYIWVLLKRGGDFMENNKTLMVIDGSSLIHRAFYALPLLSTKSGLYTSGVYGFLTMLYKIQEDYDIDYICVVFGKKGPTFRHEIFESYKGHRESTPDE